MDKLSFLSLTNQDKIAIFSIIPLVLIAGLAIAVVIINIVKKVKNKKNPPKPFEFSPENKQLREEIVNSLGGDENIVKVSSERNKLIIDVVDPTLIKTEELKVIENDGILLIGSSLRIISVQTEFYDQLLNYKEETNEEKHEDN